MESFKRAWVVGMSFVGWFLVLQTLGVFEVIRTWVMLMKP